MSTIIRIDRSSVKPNPDAGKTEWTVPTLKWFQVHETINNCCTEYRSIGRPDVTSNPDGSVTIRGRFFAVSQNFTGPPFKNAPPLGLAEKDREFTSSPTVRIELKQEYETYRTARPPSPWLYTYELTPVTCNNCGATFMHTKLEDLDVIDSDGDERTIDVCPKCKSPDFGDIEFEKIGPVIKELGLI
jgi:hypothetical protein